MYSSIKNILRIATPLIVAQLAVICNGLSDVYFSSNHSPQTGAIVGVASSIFVTFAATLIALMHGLSPIFAEQWGRDDKYGLGESLKAGLFIAVASAALLSILIHFFLDSLLLVFDVPAELWQPVRSYLRIAMCSLPAVLIARVYFVMASAVDKQKTVVYVNVISLFVKVVVSWILISGQFGFESLGALACAISTVAMFFASLMASCFLFTRSYFLDIRKAFFSAKFNLNAVLEVLKLGIPMSISQFAEITSLTIISLIVAPLGTLYIASHQILSSLTVLSFTFPYCVGMAAQILISRSLGHADYRRAVQYSKLGIALSSLLAFLLCTLFFALRSEVISTFSVDTSLSNLLIPIFPIFSIYIFFDAVQASINSSLRGFKVVVFPTVVYTAFLWIIGVIGGWALCYGKIDMPALKAISPTYVTSGLSGIWFAGASSLVLIVPILFIRLRVAERKKRYLQSGK